jgi:hypothetical protein
MPTPVAANGSSAALPAALEFALPGFPGVGDVLLGAVAL